LRLACLVLSAVALIFPNSVVASPDGQKLRVSPVKIEITTDPGETATRTIQLANQGTVPFTVRVQLSDYYVRPDGTFVFTPPGHASYSCAAWMKVPFDKIDLAPHEIRDYPMVLEVPKEVEPGEHHSSVLFSLSTNDAQSSGLQVNGRVGTLVLVKVRGGEESELGEVGSLVVRRKMLSRRVESTLPFRVKGNVHLNVIEDLTVFNILGREVGRVTGSPETVLPGSTRLLPATWTAPYFGYFTARAHVRYGPSLAAFNYGSSAPAVSFWVVTPEAIAAIGLFAIVLIALIATAVRIGRREKSPVNTSTSGEPGANGNS
jgi:hypothetical protein